MNQLAIIEAPSNLGLIEPSPGKEPGVKKLPALLKSLGFYEELGAVEILQVDPPAYGMDYDAEAGVRNADKIAAYSKLLGQRLSDRVINGKFPVVIGGDCSILIGCMYGLKTIGKFGLFFMDGHTDYVQPHGSFTKGAAGMDLAIVAGLGHEKLTDMDSRRPYVREEQILAFGNRYYAEKYVEEIENSGIMYYNLNAIRKLGTLEIVDRFLSRLTETACKGCWIHLDVDVLNNDIMPCVDSPQPDGLTYPELKSTLKQLLQSGLVAGMDITILDPDRDPEGQYAKDFVRELGSVFSTAGEISKRIFNA